jgi:ribosomal protein L37AE/L43A
MTYNYHRQVTCPLCESGEMFQIYPFLARCTGCGETISYGFFNTLRQLENLRDARGKHACECGHPEMRSLPDGTYHCPSCSTDISYP